MADINIKIQLEAAKAQAQLAKLAAQTAKFNAQAERANASTSRIKRQVDKLGTAAKQTGKSLSVANIAMASFIGNLTSRAVSSAVTSLIGGIRGLVDAGKDFEVGLVNVSKTTGISGKALESLGRSIQDIGKEIPVSTAALLEIATVAGQLGLKGSANITQFTETMAKLQLATNITGEEGSQAVAKILDITGELEEDGTQNIQKFGSVITKLGNDFAATESQILKVANEVAKGVAAFDVSSQDVLGLATAFKVTGSEAETSGSAIQRTFIEMGKAVNAGGSELAKFSDAAGLTGEEFSQLFKSDPTKAFLALAKGLGDTSENGADLAVKLSSLGLGSLRVTKALVPLISRYGLLSRSISTARKESEDLTALNEEAIKAQDTLAADLQLLSNSFDRFGVVLFDKVGPALRSIVQGMADFFDIISNNALTIKAITAGVIAASAAFFLMTSSFVASQVAAISLSVALVGPLTASLIAVEIAAASAWAALLAPLTLIVIGVAAVTAGIVLLVDKLGEAARVAKQHKDNVEELSGAYEDLDTESQNFLGSLTQSVTGMETANLVNKRYGDTILDTTVNLRELSVEELHRAEVAAAASKRVLAFETEKLSVLKRFYKEDEIAKIEANFAKIKSDKEQAAFLQTFISEGQTRQTQAHLRTLGLDKATIESARLKFQELKTLRQAQIDYDSERDAEILAKEEQLKLAQQESRQAELAAELFLSDSKIAFKDKEFELLVSNLDKEQQAKIAAALSEVKTETDKQILLEKLRKQSSEKQISDEKSLAKATAQLERKKVSDRRSSLNTIASLQNSNSKTLAAIGKAAAITQIAIETPVAVSKALSAFPPPINFIAAAAVGAAMAAQAAQVAGVKFEQGGIVGGTSFTGDKVQARVNSGEMILNRQQQSQLFKQANGQGGSGGQQGTVVNQPIIIQIDNETVGEATSKWVANGGQLGEVQ